MNEMLQASDNSWAEAEFGAVEDTAPRVLFSGQGFEPGDDAVEFV
jgi:hypothetical protein